MQSKGFSFEGQNIYIGIDVHLKTWAVAIMIETGVIERFSQESEASILYAHLQKRYPGGNYFSVYESGFCGFSTHYCLQSFGINNIVVNAADVPTSQKEKVHKTDPVDAVKLVKSLKSRLLHSIYIPERAVILDRDLVRTRTAIVKDVSRWKTRIKHLLYRHGVKYPERFANTNTHWSRRFVKWLEEEVELLPGSSREPLLQHIASYLVSCERLLDITRKIRTLSRNETYAQNMELLRSVPGIGFHTAISFLTEMGDIHRFSNEKFIGIVPTSHSSGEKENIGEMTFRGNKHVRQQLVECAWKAISKDLALGACYGRYCQRMDENNAIIRIARKLSNRILTVLKTKRKYVNERNH
ncbi:MAG: hypothetical protein EZS26_002035 [Candidatus Ordinivivax streblomastigis]|uniref:Uncharacterized protein n=1 Tax=Candidatus Ordinivivax streblomastigis TaxID=2540710 RepID=A0A5M8P035_9BACT|nr:MAG: hypothetical protein EZS26_002035 [Candidatus Ordinivivax streblomastigis]